MLFNKEALQMKQNDETKLDSFLKNINLVMPAHELAVASRIEIEEYCDPTDPLSFEELVALGLASPSGGIHRGSGTN